jgi:putative radical SAM enzyme (TIGR03279 family)
MSGCFWNNQHGGPETGPPSPPTLRARGQPARSASAATGVVVAAVRAGTVAAKAGLRAGDRLLAVNGHALRDAIDFQFHAADSFLRFDVERDGLRRPLTVDVDLDGPRPPTAFPRPAGARAELGVELEPPRPGDIATCANKCVFCFIHQLPRGMRKSLYVKDDDYRLSFLHGNYITLTDLDEADFDRIVEQRLSPLYVSVHATDPALRHRLLGQPRRTAEILPRLERLAKARIRVHAQIVLCPDLNDGAHLARTVAELAPLHPHVATVAIVPVGLTRHRDRLPALRVLGSDEAAELIATVAAWQRDFLATLGSRFVFLADEIYLSADRHLPPARAYEGFPVIEDGIGLVRHFEDGWRRSLARRRARRVVRDVTLVTGEMFAPRLAALVASLDASARARLAAVPNEFFGRGIGVAGLLTGVDIQRELARRGDLGETVLVPAVTVRDGDGVFLDDVTPADLARDLGVPVALVAPSPGALLDALCR